MKETRRHFVFSGLALILLSIQSVAAQVQPAVITLERTGCYGACPSYKITIAQDGSVEYEGKQFVRVTGKLRSSIEKRDVESLIQDFRGLGYFRLKDRYRPPRDPGDGATTITSFNFSGRHKQVSDYLGAPPALRDLEDRIDRVVNSKRWISIDAETIHEKCKDGWNVNGQEGWMLLADAVFSGDADVVRAFIAEGLDVKKPDGFITLIDSAKGKEVFQLLIAAGADVNGDPKFRKVKYPPLIQAAQLGDADSVRVLLDAGARVDIEGNGGVTALMIAAQSGSAECVRLLLAAGADLRKRDFGGRDAMEFVNAGEKRCEPQESHREIFGRTLDCPASGIRMKFQEVRQVLAEHTEARN